MTTLPRNNPGVPDAARQALPGAAMASALVSGARSMGEADLERRTLAAYRELYEQVAKGDRKYIVRMWNFIPALLDPTDGGRDRYMAFNAGRYAAMCEWFGGPENLQQYAPAGTGVGTDSDDLTIYALALAEPGTAIQNPRQRPAVHYSPRYGPRPPCFARATRVGNVLLVSGTAAITGEESVEGDLDRQLDVTLQNLRALVGDLSAFTSIRAYVSVAADVERVRSACRSAFPHAGDGQFFNVDLCRRELLVEIEGVAVQSNA